MMAHSFYSSLLSVESRWCVKSYSRPEYDPRQKVTQGKKTQEVWFNFLSFQFTHTCTFLPRGAFKCPIKSGGWNDGL